MVFAVPIEIEDIKTTKEKLVEKIFDLMIETDFLDCQPDEDKDNQFKAEMISLPANFHTLRSDYEKLEEVLVILHPKTQAFASQQ